MTEPKVIFIEQDPFGPEQYLGDGLYASFNGHQYRLRAPRGTEDHEVFLEPAVLQAFMNYVRRVSNGQT